MGLCQGSKNLGTLLDLKAVLTEEDEFFVLCRNSRCLDDEARSLLLTGKRNLCCILLIMNEHAFFLKLASQI